MYCDGASFAGNTSAPVVVNGTKLYFRGLAVLEEVFSSLLAAGLGKADELLVKGGSAGGLAVYLHLDYIRTLIPATVQVRANTTLKDNINLHISRLKTSDQRVPRCVCGHDAETCKPIKFGVTWSVQRVCGQ